MQPASSAAARGGCLALFGAAFAAAGLFMLLAWSGRVQLTGGDSRPPLLTLSTAFVLIGVLIGGYGTASAARAMTVRRLQRAHPDEPWMWRSDWAAGQVTSNESEHGSRWFFAIVWCSLAFPATFLAFNKEGTPLFIRLAILLFPLIGVYLLYSAVRRAAQRAKFGATRLSLPRIPLRLGERVQMRLFSRRLESAELIAATIECIRVETRGSGKSRRVYEVLLWQHDVQIDARFGTPESDGLTLPLDFVLPMQGEETRVIDARDRILWRIRVVAELPGVDYEETFELPVFGHAAHAAPAAKPLSDQPRIAPRTVIVERQLGKTCFLFPAGQNRREVATSTLAALVSVGIIAAAVAAGSPFFLKLIVSVAGVFLVLAAIDAWLGTASIEVRNGEVRLTRSNGITTSSQSFRRGEIVKLQISARTSSNQQRHARFRLEARQSTGKRVPLGRFFSRRHDAEWLGRELAPLLGIDPPDANAIMRA